jgi:hypothetical protein
VSLGFRNPALNESQADFSNVPSGSLCLLVIRDDERLVDSTDSLCDDTAQKEENNVYLKFLVYMLR